MTGKHPFSDASLQYLVPETTSVVSIAQGGFYLVPEIRGQCGQSPVAGRNKGFQAGAYQSCQYGRCAAGGYGCHYRRPIDHRRHDKAAILWFGNHIYRYAHVYSCACNGPIDLRVICGRHDQMSESQVLCLIVACYVFQLALVSQIAQILAKFRGNHLDPATSF